MLLAAGLTAAIASGCSSEPVVAPEVCEVVTPAMVDEATGLDPSRGNEVPKVYEELSGCSFAGNFGYVNVFLAPRGSDYTAEDPGATVTEISIDGVDLAVINTAGDRIYFNTGPYYGWVASLGIPSEDLAALVAIISDEIT